MLGSLNFMSDRVDWDGIRKELSEVDWALRTTETSPEEAYKEICEILSEICPKYAPTKTSRTATSVPRDRRILMRKRSRLIKRLSKVECNRAREAMVNRAASLERQLV
jgi:hypothetical protein